MLDIHASVGTAGAVLTMAQLATLIATDGLNVVGVPLRPDATLIMWGSSSIIANTIAATKLISQDCMDPINGENINLGSASLKNLFYKTTRIPFSTGNRQISQGTNTAQTANSLAITVDAYEAGSKVGDCIGPDGPDGPLRIAKNMVMVPQVLVADVAIAWTVTPFAPATPIPNGKYALLGFTLSKATEAHLIRFAHADFGFCLPGIPCVDHMASAILGLQKGMQDPIGTDPGFQFVALSELLKKPCVPVFTVSNAATGLNIQSISATATDTPNVTPYLAKIG
jgi:hypothetical protein